MDRHPLDRRASERRSDRRAERRAHDQPLAEDRRRLLAPRLVALFAAGCLLFGYPFLDLFSQPVTVLGVPLLFVYLFVAWAVFIAALAWLVETGEPRR